jgi:hypothetical protein
MALTAAVMVVAFSVTNTMGADQAADGPNHAQRPGWGELLFHDPPPDGETAPADQPTSGAERAAKGENDLAVTVPAAAFSPATVGQAITGHQDQVFTGPADNHGQCVKQVAGSPDTGGPQDNHGGAVNEAARVTCWQTNEGVVGGTDTAPAPDAATPGNSGAAHEKNEAHKGGSGGGNPNKPPKPDKPPKSK